ncbi:NYN domain-containing protein [Niallia alba]|uniref:NYN domain-containing protein n=1 Tax=Niallia alba TaxID=2729105 RepID=UPI002E1CC306|nr:NYN domain-containing protein [Niallia alba]
MNVAIYVDYDNLHKRLKEYGIDPVVNLNFFSEIRAMFKRKNYQIIKFIVFGNFEDSDFTVKDMTNIHNFGVEVKHCSVDGKSSTDMELTIEVMDDLYTKNNIALFALVSNDRDYVPLYRAIKRMSKSTYSLTTKNGHNDVTIVFNDYHEYIEDIFNLTQEQLETYSQKILPEKDISEDLICKAKDASQLLYSSKLWKGFCEGGKIVTLRGYVNMLNKSVWKRETKSNITNYFVVANTLGYILLRENDSGEVYFEEGIKFAELFDSVEDTKKEVDEVIEKVE